MGSNIPSWTEEALGRRLTPSQFLASPADQDSVFDRFFGKSVAKYGNPQDAASVWFTGRPQASARNASDILGTTSTQYVDKFNSALGKLDTTAVGATNSLGSFGSGLGQFSQNLVNSFPAAPSGGGNWFSNLFGGLFGGGGLNAYGNSVLGSSSQFAGAWGAGGIGLFDRGGWTGPGAVDEPAGVVHRGEIVWSQKDIARHGGPETVEAMRLGRRGYLSGGVVDGSVSPANGRGADRPTFQIINQTSTPITGQVEERQDESGRRQWQLTLSDQMGVAAQKKGGDFRRTMTREFGAKPRGIAR
jgi:phage-related minor tail protein